MADQFTILRQQGYYGTYAEMKAAYDKDHTGHDTIGEQVEFALDAQMALDALGINTSGTPTVNVPTGLVATGTANGTTFLRGDGAWATPAGTDKTSIGLGNVDNTSDLNKPISTAQGAINTAQTATNLLKANAADAVLTGNPTAPTQTAGNNTTRLATTAFVVAAVGTVAQTYANAIAGNRFDIPCPGGVQPNRPSARTDIYFDWLMIAEPSQAANKAIQGDGWRREAW